jgi:hypothetical protein
MMANWPRTEGASSGYPAAGAASGLVSAGSDAVGGGCHRVDDLDLAITYDYNLAPASPDPVLETAPLWSTPWGMGVRADTTTNGIANLSAFAGDHPSAGRTNRTRAGVLGSPPRDACIAEPKYSAVGTKGIGVDQFSDLQPVGHLLKRKTRVRGAPEVPRCYAFCSVPSRSNLADWPEHRLIDMSCESTLR